MVACGSSSSSPSTPGPTNTTPTVTSVSVTGTTPAIPTATQFTATATMSDNTTLNVTQTSSWSSSNTAVATAVAGLVTPLTQGDATVTATYQSVAGRASITIAKPLPYTISGVVTDGTSGGTLPNIVVGATDSSGAILITTTNASGAYSISNVLAGPQVTVAASAQTGYFAQSKNVPVAGNTTVNFVMQRF